LDHQDSVRDVRGREPDFWLGRLEPLDLSRQRGTARAVLQVQSNLVAGLLRQLLLDLAAVLAKQRVLVQQTDAWALTFLRVSMSLRNLNIASEK